MSAPIEPGSVLDPGASPIAVSVLAEPVVLEGGVVLATVRTRALRDVVLQGGDVVLSAALAYKYVTGGIFGATYSSIARDTIEAARQSLPAPTLLRAGNEVEHQVLLTVPAEGLPTTDCDLVSIEWTVRARVKFEGRGRVDAAPVAFVVVSEGLPGGPLALPPTGGTVRLDAVRPRRIAAGTVLSGDVVVPRRVAGAVRTVRVELVLAQMVPHGPMIGDNPARNPYVAEKEEETVVARVRLAGGEAGVLPPPLGDDVRLPFRLEVPVLRAPTLVTASFTLRWFVRAVVERRMAGLPRSARCELEVIGSTVPPGVG